MRLPNLPTAQLDKTPSVSHVSSCFCTAEPKHTRRSRCLSPSITTPALYLLPPFVPERLWLESPCPSTSTSTLDTLPPPLIPEQASKTLSLERDVLSVTCRLDAAEAERDSATRARREVEDARRAVATVLDNLAELVFEALPPPPPPLPPIPIGNPTTTIGLERGGGGGSGSSCRRGVGSLAGENGDVNRTTTAASEGGGKSEKDARGGGGGVGESGGVYGSPCGGDSSGRDRSVAIAKLSQLEAGIRAGRMVDHARKDAAGGEMGTGRQGGRGGDGGGRGVYLPEEAELRRVVRAVRTLAEAGARVAADRDGALNEVCVGFVGTRKE